MGNIAAGRLVDQFLWILQSTVCRGMLDKYLCTHRIHSTFAPLGPLYELSMGKHTMGSLTPVHKGHIRNVYWTLEVAECY